MSRTSRLSWFVLALALSLSGWRSQDFRASCPCMPGSDGADSAGLGAVDDADAGCGCSLQFRCVCGVTPPGEDPADSGDESAGAGACDDQTPVTLYLSADDSNSMSSPVQAREAILGEFSSITAVPIRPWEFFNYYDFAYPPAPAGELAVTAEMGHLHGTNGQFSLQIGVRSPALDAEDRPPIDVTLVLDTSGSMQGQPLALLQEVCRAIAANLRDGDHVSMVTWSSDQAVILAAHAVAGPDDPELLAAIDAVAADGSTDLHAGLVVGYDLAAETAEPGRVGRVVLISDGGANTGVTDIDLIAAHAGAEDEDGIYLVGVGVGSAASYNDTLMDSVTDAGKGASVFVPGHDEAWRMFDARFLDTLLIAARDVQVRVDLPPGFAIQSFSGEEYSADPAEVEPQHLAPNDAMVLHQRLTTCAPGLVTPDSAVTVTARYLDAATFEPHEVSVTRSFAALLADASPRLLKGDAMLAYTEALTAARLGSDHVAAKVQLAVQAVDTADAALPNDPTLVELRAVLQKL
jgi:Ca-activated chloride channel family protein